MISAIQTSAAINPGNSGGALADLAGQVIGIPTLAATDPQLGGDRLRDPERHGKTTAMRAVFGLVKEPVFSW